MLERLQRPESKEFAQQRLKEHRNEPTYFSGSCADLVSTKNMDSRRGMAKAQFGVRRKNPPKEDRFVKGSSILQNTTANVSRYIFIFI